MTARASVVFPEPDSPTSARHSRSCSWSETPSRTCRAPWNALHAGTSSSAAASAGASRAGSAARADPAELADADAAGAVAGRDRDRRRRRLLAGRKHRGQRGANTQPGRPRPGRRHAAGDRLEQPARRDVRDRADQLARVRVRGLDEERIDRALLDDAPRVHDEHAAGQAADRRQVVADVDAPHVSWLCAQLAHGREHVRLRRHVEPGRRLVEHDQRGPQQERHREADALLLAARELVRIAAQELAVAAGRRTSASARDGCARRSVRLAVLVDHLRELRADAQRRG